MKEQGIASVVILLSCCFVVACQKGDRWKEYKYRNDGFAISAPTQPLLRPPIPDEPDSRTYGINYGNHTEILFGLGNLGTWENLSPKAKTPAPRGSHCARDVQ